MSTRGHFGFHSHGKDFVAYNHSDSYPSGLGVDILAQTKILLKKYSIPELRGKAHIIRLVDNSVKPTAEDIEILKPYTDLGVSEQSTSDWYCLLRKLQGDLIGAIEVGYMLKSSVNEEYAYILNFDDETLEVYDSGKTPKDGERYPIGLVKTYSLNKLPSESKFLKEVEPQEEE